jgi:hypothetical protein
MSVIAHIINKNPGCDFRRARAKSDFGWHQSYEQNTRFTVAAQA